MRADGCCMVEAVLPQFLHHKEKYNSELLQRQVGLHLLKHANLFYPFVQHDLEAMNESYELYCVNVFTGQVWRDDLILSAIGHMFNIAITIITPCFDKPVALFHKKDIPDMVVIANGGDYLVSSKPSTHFWKHQLLLLPVTHSGVGSTSVVVSGWNSKLLVCLEVRIV